MNLAVEFRGLTKSFHGVPANEGIHLKVRKGSIHAIVGENGAGKSTAMKLLYGTYQPDSGEIWIDGKLWAGLMRPWASPSEAIRNGVGMVHQHFMLGEPHTVLDNILLGVEDSRRRWKWLPPFLRPIDRKNGRERLKKLSTQYGMAVDWNAKVEDLSVGIHQRIEILKILYRDAKILILDEPTAVLTPQETMELFRHLKELSREGKTILIITHKLKEVMSYADRVTVFRSGKVVGEREVSETNEDDLATLMVGRKVNLKKEPPAKPLLKEPVLEMEGVQLKARCSLKNLSFKVRGGEVVGISGVEGNGQSELLQLLLHPREYAQKMSGTIRVLGRDTKGMATDQIKQSGVGMIPEDRLKEGLLLDRPAPENFLLGLQRRAPFFKNGLLSESALIESTEEAIKKYDIRPRSLKTATGHYSGGNQQKLIIAREFWSSPKLLIAAQPTRGVDVGAIEFIHHQILQARAQGTGVLLVSSELDEILALSDRILVMFEGQIVAEFQRGEATERTLGLRMGGAAPL